jgi:hypothetical protein
MGEYACTVDPYAEADPVAILTQGLMLFGSVIGRDWLIRGPQRPTVGRPCRMSFGW